LHSDVPAGTCSSAAWSGESTYRPSELTGALSGSTWLQGFQRFTVAGATEARNRMLLTTGASVFFGERGSAFVMYDGALSDIESQHGVSAGVRVHW
jgi:uncharacterized protein with beta-barrel porin domain